MRRFTISCVVALLLGITGASAQQGLLGLDYRTHQRREGWARILPTHIKGQYAGGMGLFSVGMGWDYGKRCRWESDLFVGYVPRFEGERSHVTFTIKQNYIPWALSTRNRRFALEPLYTGLYLNTISGEEFWRRQPDRYPSGYYWFSTRLRIHLFVGLRATLYTPQCESLKGVTLFFEANTCDLYLSRKAGDKYLKWGDIIGLSAGVKFQLF